MTGFAVDLRRVAPIRGSCHFGLRRSVWTLWAAGGLVDEQVDRDLMQRLVAVIAEELEPQAGMERRPERVPMLVADAVLDHFDVRAKPDLTLPSS
jgi:hypothetical protein